MRHYLCECTVCHTRQQYAFDEPYPGIGDSFPRPCNQCGEITPHSRVLTRKAMAELRAAEEEATLRQEIVEKCERMGFACRFVYESVVISTPVSSWQFDYHRRLKTLRHESTIKVNFKTGDPAFTHEQFRDMKMSNDEVIDYIAAHDAWRAKQ